MARRLVVVGGGVRSGKSRFAVGFAGALPGPRCFLATAAASDEEMQARIAKHRLERGSAFETVEAAQGVGPALAVARTAPVVVIDCLTICISNLLLAHSELSDAQGGRDDGEQLVRRAVGEILDFSQTSSGTLIVVTNEVGMGVVPPSPLGRQFRDWLGLANQLVAAPADELYWAMLGVLLRLRPEPVGLAPAAAAPTTTSEYTRAG